MTIDDRRDPSRGGPAAGDFDVAGAARFRAQLGTTFDVDFDTGRIPLRLAEVADGRTGGGFARFSVLFHGPADRVLAQGTYVFHHGVLGSLALFIVPILGSDAERIVYEACFSQPVPPGNPSRESS